MLKCPECGYLSFEEERLCPKCGTQLNEPEQGEETDSFLQPPAASVTETKTSEKIPENNIPAAETIDELPEAEPEIIPIRKESEVAPEMQFEKTEKPLEDFSVPETPPLKTPQPEPRIGFKDERIVSIKKIKQEELPIKEKSPGLKPGGNIPFLLLSRGAGFLIDNIIIIGIVFLFTAIPLYIVDNNIASFSNLFKETLLSFYLLLILIHIYYNTFFLTATGQTPGKAITGVKVVGLGGLKLEWHEAFLRSIGYFLSAIPAGGGFIWAFFDHSHQAWHDKLVGSKVVGIERSS